MRQTEEMQAICRQIRLFFSAVYLNNQFSKAIWHITQIITQLFCFIKASREGNKISNQYIGHLARFFQLGLSENLTLKPLMSIIASSI